VEQKERFSSLRKWFYKIIVKPKEQQQENFSSSLKNFKDFSQELDQEYSEEIAKLEQSKESNESKLNETLKDWINHTKISVAVTGASGVGKSLLINTLLETTYEEKKDNDETVITNQTKADSSHSLLLLSSHSLEHNKSQLSNTNLYNNLKKKTTSSSTTDEQDDLDVMISSLSYFRIVFVISSFVIDFFVEFFFISGCSMRVGVPLHHHTRKQNSTCVRRPTRSKALQSIRVMRRKHTPFLNRLSRVHPIHSSRQCSENILVRVSLTFTKI
jgi:hypothetical protein